MILCCDVGLSIRGAVSLHFVFQMNRQESCSQADLEEKMVHKVTMDTVRIITASVSGVINVSDLPRVRPSG